MGCPVCFGGEDTAMRESLNAGIGVLMGVTAIVLAGFARFIVLLARRSRIVDKWGRESFVEENGVGSHFPRAAGEMTPDPIFLSNK
jgi:hypothetical protein